MSLGTSILFRSLDTRSLGVHKWGKIPVGKYCHISKSVFFAERFSGILEIEGV